MTGGAERVVPLYKEPVNSPFIPNIQKEIYGQRQIEKGIYPEPNQYNQSGQNNQSNQTGQNQQPKGLDQIVNLQVYQPKKAPSNAMRPPTLFQQPYTTTPYLPPQYYYQVPPFMQPPCGGGQVPIVPVVNQYNINIDGVNGDHNKLSLIYEDMLPSQYGKPFAGTAATIGERILVYNAVKGMMFTQGDGKNIGLDGKGDNSLLSHLKFMDLNPYNTYKLSPNPYKGLPLGFLLYRSCYPIRHDPVGSTVVCAKNSVGMNVRIYKMTNGSFMLNTQKNSTIKDYEEWREISYYEYVREYIIKKKQIPNFVMMDGYYIAENSNIDFDKIALIKGVQPNRQPNFISVNNAGNPIPPVQSPLPLANVPANSSTSITPINRLIVNDVVRLNDRSFNTFSNNLAPQQISGQNPGQISVINPDAYTGKALVAVTESPNYNLYGWASKTYQIDGNVKRQINTGFHQDKVWYSVLFQIIVALYCMQIHKICFNDFTAEDNIYIKDLNISGSVTKYWKYKIDGIDYYIPNYGYVVWIDTNFKDIDLATTTTLNTYTSLSTTTAKTHKIYAEFLDDKIDFNSKCFEAFIKSIDTNMFTQEFLNDGGCTPPPEVIFLMNQIRDEASADTNKNIGKYLWKYMKQFMNNRIGSYLKETEIANIRKEDQKDFTKGSMVVYEDGSSSYKFALFIDLVTNGTTSTGTATILYKNDPTNDDIIEIQVPVTSLYMYSKAEPIMQNYKPTEAILNEEDLLETYILYKL